MNATKHRPNRTTTTAQRTRACTVAADPTPSFLRPGSRRQVDLNRTRVGFGVRKLGTMTVHGTFAATRGTLSVEAGAVSASGAVSVASLATGDGGRDAHLQGPGFFDAQSFPEITFRSSTFERLDGDRLAIRGSLTIRDRACEIDLIGIEAPGDGLKFRGQIDRRDFGLTWNRAIEATGAVANRVDIELDVALI